MKSAISTNPLPDDSILPLEESQNHINDQVIQTEAMLNVLIHQHPAVLQKLHGYRAKKSSGDLSTVYPDPMFGIFLLNYPYHSDLHLEDDRTPMSGIEYRLTQPIPFPGRLTKKGDVEKAEADLSGIALLKARSYTAASFLSDLISYRKSVKIYNLTGEFETTIRLVSDAAEARYTVGKGSMPEIAAARVKHGIFIERTESSKGDVASNLANLEYYLDVIFPDQSSRDTKQELIDKFMDSGHLDAYLRVLKERGAKPPEELVLGTLDYQVALIVQRRAASMKTLAYMEYLPDFEIFAAYRKRPYLYDDPVRGENFMSFGLSMRVPLWSSIYNHRRISEKGNMESSANLEEENIKMRTISEMRSQKAKLESLDKQIAIYNERVIPGAKLGRDSARLSYETGRGAIGSLLEAWTNLYQARIRLIELEAERERFLVAYAGLGNFIIPDNNLAVIFSGSLKEREHATEN